MYVKFSKFDHGIRLSHPLDSDDISASPDLLVKTFQHVGRLHVLSVCQRQAEVGQRLLNVLLHPAGELGILAAPFGQPGRRDRAAPRPDRAGRTSIGARADNRRRPCAAHSRARCAGSARNSTARTRLKALRGSPSSTPGDRSQRASSSRSRPRRRASVAGHSFIDGIFVDFAYLPEEDAYRCPVRDRLPYRYTKQHGQLFCPESHQG